MKVNRPIDDCRCWNCRNFAKCDEDGVFDENSELDFCINYEDETYPDDDNDEND